MRPETQVDALEITSNIDGKHPEEIAHIGFRQGMVGMLWSGL
jgi:hypothetical protein